MPEPTDFNPSCPLPRSAYPQVLLAHGGGGRLMQNLLSQVFFPAFQNPILDQLHDGAVLAPASSRIAFTTDSYVVRPLFFPGGDIGTLAVYGTVNDLAMCGARPRWLSAGFILEEGLPLETLTRVTQSMRRAAARAGVQIVTGDTKVVDKGKGDGVFINTAGIGTLEHPVTLGPRQVQAGDAILVSGDLGRHGMAILSVREGLEFETQLESDCAPLADLVHTLLDAAVPLHCLRDLTRGGLAAALNEIATAAHVQPDIVEDAVPVIEPVRAACEIVGFDPLYVANEGRMVLFVPEEAADRAVALLRTHPEGAGACRIGTVRDTSPGSVTLRSRIGAQRILDLFSGEQLPRIC